MAGELSPETLSQITDAVLSAVDARIDEKLASLNTEHEDEIETDAPGAENEMGEHYAKMCQYMADGDDASIYEMLDGMDDEAKKKLADHIEANEADEEKRGKLTQYMAQPSDEIAPEKAKEVLTDGEVHGHELTDKQKGMFGAAAGRQSTKPGTAAHYMRERDEWQRKYQKEVRMHGDTKKDFKALSDRVAVLERERREAVRYQKIEQLRNEGYPLDFEDDEVAELLDLTDEQFDKRLEREARKCERNQTRIPLNRTLRVMEEQPVQSRQRGATGDQFAKRAKEIADERRAKGEKNVTWDSCMQLAQSEGRKESKAAATA